MYLFFPVDSEIPSLLTLGPFTHHHKFIFSVSLCLSITPSVAQSITLSLQYIILRIDRNGRNSKKSKTIFVASPVEMPFVKSSFPNKGKTILTLFRKCLCKLSDLYHCHDSKCMVVSALFSASSNLRF